MSKSNTMPRTAIRNRRVTKAEASSELQQLLEEIQSMEREAQALQGEPSETGDSMSGSVMREETDPVDDASAGDWKPGDAEENTDTVERGRRVRRVRRDTEPDPNDKNEDEEVGKDDDENFTDQHLEPDDDDLLAGRITEPGQKEAMMARRSMLRRELAKVERAIITGDPDASTASGKAEDRVDDIPEWDEENVDEIAKAIVRLATGTSRRAGAVRRSASAGSYRGSQEYASDDQLALNFVTKQLLDLKAELSGLKLPLSHILEGLGVSKAFEEAQPPVRKSQGPALTADQPAVAKELLNAILRAAGGDSDSVIGTNLSQAEGVRKNLGQLVGLMEKEAGQKWSPVGQ